MLKKSLAFGLLAAGLMVAPGAAFADSQSQNNNQTTIQSGTAIGGSTNAQSSESLNVQEQIKNRQDSIKRRRGGGYGRRRGYRRPSYCPSSYNGQSQNSSQGTVQSGGAIDGSVNAQSNSNVNDQKQVANNSRTCK